MYGLPKIHKLNFLLQPEIFPQANFFNWTLIHMLQFLLLVCCLDFAALSMHLLYLEAAFLTLRLWCSGLRPYEVVIVWGNVCRLPSRDLWRRLFA